MKLITKVVIAIVVLALLGGVVYLYAIGFFGEVGLGFQCSGAREYEEKYYGVNLCWVRKGLVWDEYPSICLIDQSQSPYGKSYLLMGWDISPSEHRSFRAIHMDNFKKVNVYMLWQGGAEGLEYTYIRDRDGSGQFIHSLLSDYGQALRNAMNDRQGTMQISDQDYLDMQCVLDRMVIPD